VRTASSPSIVFEAARPAPRSRGFRLVISTLPETLSSDRVFGRRGGSNGSFSFLEADRVGNSSLVGPRRCRTPGRRRSGSLTVPRCIEVAPGSRGGGGRLGVGGGGARPWRGTRLYRSPYLAGARRASYGARRVAPREARFCTIDSSRRVDHRAIRARPPSEASEDHRLARRHRPRAARSPAGQSVSASITSVP